MARSARTQGYSRRHRFTTRGSFGPVLRQSRKMKGDLAVLHAMPAASGVSRLGVALTRRLVRQAVLRNRVKRIAREIFRCHPVKLAGFDCVIALRERFEAASAPALRAEIHALFDRLEAGKAR